MSIDLSAAPGAPSGYQSGDLVVVKRPSSPDVPYTLPYPAVYTLPAATTAARGGVRPDGTTIVITGDVISAVGGGGSGVVGSGTTNQLAYYAGTGVSVSGLTLSTSFSIATGTLSLAQATTAVLGGVTFSASNPAANGTAAPGTSNAAARSDHVHATDATRAPLIYSSVAVAAPVTLSFNAHHGHELYATASVTVTVPSAGTLGDGFWTCLFTDTTHTVTLSGTVYDLLGNLVTSIQPSTKAEIWVAGGQVYVSLESGLVPGSLTHGTVSSAINFVGYDGSNNDFRFGFADFVPTVLSTGGSFTKAVAVTPVSLTYGATTTINATLGNNFRIVLTGNVTFANPTGLVDGQEINLRIKQDGTGSRTAAWGTKWKWGGGAAPTLTTTANAVDRVSGIYVLADDVIEATFKLAYA